MSLQVVKFDESVLRQETKDVDIPVPGDIKLLAAQMIQTMVEAKGLGLAAPQVDRPERLFVAVLADTYHVFINPVIVETSDAQSTDEEACLSLPGVVVKVRRPKIVWVTYYDAAGVLHERKKFKRMHARVVQHELDHLEGKLIVDYANGFQFGE